MYPPLLLQLHSELPRLEVPVIGPTLQLGVAHHNLPFLRLDERFHVLYLLRSVLNELQQPAILLEQLKLVSLNGVVFV